MEKIKPSQAASAEEGQELLLVSAQCCHLVFNCWQCSDAAACAAHQSSVLLPRLNALNVESPENSWGVSGRGGSERLKHSSLLRTPRMHCIAVHCYTLCACVVSLLVATDSAQALFHGSLLWTFVHASFCILLLWSLLMCCSVARCYAPLSMCHSMAHYYRL